MDDEPGPAFGATRATRGTAVTAAAVVMDQGGQLSHGSILAREYGIPCVVNVGPATKVIKTGRRIEVDGNRGIVRLLGGPSEKE